MLGVGLRHLRAEWGRWWRAEDLTDTHIAHRILNDQYRMWRAARQRVNAEVQQNIKLLRDQQRQQTYMQMQRMQMMRQAAQRGGYGGFYGMGGGASPMVSYRMMQWAQLQMRIGQEEFRHVEVTDGMLAVGRGQVRSRRHRAAAVWMLGLAALWALLWWLSPLAGLAAGGAAAVLLLLVAAVQGRNPKPRQPPVPKLAFAPPAPPAHTELAADPEPEPEPRPIRAAGRDPDRARESVTLALRKEGIQTSHVAWPVETDWGWIAEFTLASGTLADIVRALPRMATTLRVGESRLLAHRSSEEDSAAITLRIMLGDPFAAPPPLPARPPGSCTITAPVSLGTSIDGADTPVVLAGQHVLIVSSSGGGKSSMVRALAEYTTACHDAVAVDVDPTGRGLGPLGPCAALRALTPHDAEQVLEQLVAQAEARIARLGPLEDNWRVGPDGPAIVVFVDEWPRLGKRAREAGLALLRIGRKARITLVVCTQDATSDVLGDAVADTFGARIMLPCRQADVPLVVGQANAVSQGWLPHLLIPSPGEWEQADAGRFYAITPRHRTPLLRYATPIPAEFAAARAQERAAAGLPRLDDGAGPSLPEAMPEIGRLLLDAFDKAGRPEALTVAQLADHLAAADPAVWGRWEERRDRVAMVGRTIRSHLRQAGLDIPTVRLDTPGRPTAYRQADVHSALS
ncbi:hypothetical protein [Streptomyces triticirhizae]|uniref:hypothetical protein n=1 Tax=Streptomyces triticirhizae TaxID=2483353 RepID=UPI0011C378E0|nr:hypothetical protein [Streptomyces triticirhizae]